MRHFNIIAYTPFDDASMQRIFQTILDWWLMKEGFDSGYVKLSSPIIAATMDIYKASMVSLLPTPSKSHYTFNLRDFARVVQGMLLSTNSEGNFEKKTDMMLLWSHEVFRVFCERHLIPLLTHLLSCTLLLMVSRTLCGCGCCCCSQAHAAALPSTLRLTLPLSDLTLPPPPRPIDDRLTDDDDRLWFIEEMKKLTMTHFEMDMDKLFAEFDMNNSGDVDDDDVRYLLYSSYTDPKASKKEYKRIKDLSQMQVGVSRLLISSHPSHLSPRPPSPLTSPHP